MMTSELNKIIAVTYDTNATSSDPRFADWKHEHRKSLLQMIVSLFR